MSTPTNSISTLPPITPGKHVPAMDTVVALVNTILTGYQAAVAALASQTGDAFKKARNQLFWGGRVGSKILGVRDQKTVEEMLRRSIMNGRKIGSIQTYPDGRNVYCFTLPHHYKGKGKTTYIRVGDLRDEGSESIALVGFAELYHEDRETSTTEIQAPAIKDRDSNIITVVMSADNSTFLEWYCGEPRMYWNKDNIGRLLGPDGTLNLDAAWLQLGVDYNVVSREKRRRQQQERQHKKDANRHGGDFGGHRSPPLNTMAGAYAAAEVLVVKHDATPPTDQSAEQPGDNDLGGLEHATDPAEPAVAAT